MGSDRDEERRYDRQQDQTRQETAAEFAAKDANRRTSAYDVGVRTRDFSKYNWELGFVSGAGSPAPGNLEDIEYWSNATQSELDQGLPLETIFFHVKLTFGLSDLPAGHEPIATQIFKERRVATVKACLGDQPPPFGLGGCSNYQKAKSAILAGRVKHHLDIDGAERLTDFLHSQGISWISFPLIDFIQRTHKSRSRTKQ